VILTDPEGVEFTYALRFQFEATNNEAEYETLIAGLRIAKKIGVQNLQVNVDSKLVAYQMEVLAVVEEEGDSWMTLIHEYLTDETLPAERKKAREIKRPSQANYIEASGNYHRKPVATITGNQVKKFVWENITNGLVERGNRSLGEGIKARVGKDNKNWIEEISHVLWAHRTMVKSSNGDTPFSLTYGTEAVIPAEIGMPTFRTAEVDVAKNDEALEINLELLEEKRKQAAIREAKSKKQMEKYYNAKV
ncbi:reverse transcriptase domain-containing protein, partial [Tanacetum coccineum]